MYYNLYQVFQPWIPWNLKTLDFLILAHGAKQLQDQIRYLWFPFSSISHLFLNPVDKWNIHIEMDLRNGFMEVIQNKLQNKFNL